MAKQGFNSAIIKKHKVAIIGVVVILLGIFSYIHLQNKQVDRVIRNHSYKLTVTGPDHTGENTQQHSVLIFANGTYKESTTADDDFSGLIDSAQNQDSASYSATKKSITLSTGYSGNDSSVAHLKNLKVSNGGKTITGEIKYSYEEGGNNSILGYREPSTETAHGTVKLERIK